MEEDSPMLHLTERDSISPNRGALFIVERVTGHLFFLQRSLQFHCFEADARSRGR